MCPFETTKSRDRWARTLGESHPGLRPRTATKNRMPSPHLTSVCHEDARISSPRASGELRERVRLERLVLEVRRHDPDLAKPQIQRQARRHGLQGGFASDARENPSTHGAPSSHTSPPLSPRKRNETLRDPRSGTSGLGSSLPQRPCPFPVARAARQRAGPQQRGSRPNTPGSTAAQSAERSAHSGEP